MSTDTRISPTTSRTPLAETKRGCPSRLSIGLDTACCQRQLRQTIRMSGTGQVLARGQRTLRLNHAGLKVQSLGNDLCQREGNSSGKSQIRQETKQRSGQTPTTLHRFPRYDTIRRAWSVPRRLTAQIRGDNRKQNYHVPPWIGPAHQSHHEQVDAPRAICLGFRRRGVASPWEAPSKVPSGLTPPSARSHT
jgi:hypothetical protein